MIDIRQLLIEIRHPKSAVGLYRALVQLRDSGDVLAGIAREALTGEHPEALEFLGRQGEQQELN